VLFLGFDLRPINVKFVTKKCGNETGFSPSTSVFVCQDISTDAAYSFSFQ
jgi:hypothetical protein